MLKDIDGYRIPFEFNGEKRYLRYNLNSALYLEYMTGDTDLIKKDTSQWELEDVLHYLRAMLLDSYYEENKTFIEERNFCKCKPTLAEIGRQIDKTGLDNMVTLILKGIAMSLPEVTVGAHKSTNPLQAV